MNRSSIDAIFCRYEFGLKELLIGYRDPRQSSPPFSGALGGGPRALRSWTMTRAETWRRLSGTTRRYAVRLCSKKLTTLHTHHPQRRRCFPRLSQIGHPSPLWWSWSSHGRWPRIRHTATRITYIHTSDPPSPTTRPSPRFPATLPSRSSAASTRSSMPRWSLPSIPRRS